MFCLLTSPDGGLGAGEYRVGEGDLLKVTVYEHEDLTTEARVSGDGSITFPLIGEVTVDDLTTAEIESTLAGLLQDGYIKKAHVAVFIKEYKSKKLTVLGEFANPGLVELRGNSTIMEVISNAGGITSDAGETLYIQRKETSEVDGTEKEVSIAIDLIKLFEKGDTSKNIDVMDGDSIYVPKAAFVYVTGEVRTPGAYKITKGLTVLKAITLAGGFTEKAWKRKIKIIRTGEEGEETVKAGMEDTVKPEDLILVPESFF